MDETPDMRAGLAMAAKFRALRLDQGEARSRDELRRSPATIHEEAEALRAEASRFDELAEDVKAALSHEATPTPAVDDGES